MPLEVGATREFLLLAFFVTCPPLIEEYLKLGLQATFATWHLPMERIVSSHNLPLVKLLSESF